MSRGKVCMLSSVHPALDNRIFYREALSLKRAGYAVAVIAVHPRREAVEGVEIIPLPRLPRWKRPLLWRRLAGLALETGADAYHFHDPELLPLGAWLKRRAGRPVVYDVHEMTADFVEIKEDIPRLARRALASALRCVEPRLARRLSALVFADEQIAAAFERVKLPKAVLYNFPEAGFVRQAAQAVLSKADPGPVVLYLGGLKRMRGTQVMVEAFARVRQELPAARLLLVGAFAPTSLEAELRGQIAARGLEAAVTITGAVPFSEVGRWLEQAALGWIAFEDVPKYQKNIPTKLFEYMAYRLPVVSSDLSPVRPFLIPGETGLLARAGDAEAHAQALLALLKDPALAQRMGGRGQALVQERFSWTEMERRLLRLYAELLEGPPSMEGPPAGRIE